MFSLSPKKQIIYFIHVKRLNAKIIDPSEEQNKLNIPIHLFNKYSMKTWFAPDSRH